MNMIDKSADKPGVFVSLPCITEQREAAVRVLHCAMTTPQEEADALEVLRHSSDYTHRNLVRDIESAKQLPRDVAHIDLVDNAMQRAFIREAQDEQRGGVIALVLGAALIVVLGWAFLTIIMGLGQ
jgi:hypothetical protein